MPIAYNASSQPHQVRVYGVWFDFPPKTMKVMDEAKVYFLESQRAYLGFVSLPDSFSDPEFKLSAEGKAILADAESRGVQARIMHLEWLKGNEMNALRRDMDRRNDKADTSAEMSPQSLTALEAAIEEIKGYKKASRGAEAEKADKLKKLTEALED